MADYQLRIGFGAADIVSANFGSPYKYNSAYPTKYASGDVWYNTWADNGEIYSTVGDFITGFSGVGPNAYFTSINQLDGFSNSMTGVEIVGNMRRFGRNGETGPDGSDMTWKPSGLTCIGGVLYMAVSRQKYGNSGTNWVQTGKDAQIIKSADYGVTWTPIPATNAYPFASPMFPGFPFGAPGFVQYGQNNSGAVHGGDTYVYAMSSDGVWNNGNSMILGRCLLTDLPNLDATDWEYFTGGNGLDNANWSSTQASAAPIISNTKKIGMAGAQYLPAFGRYVMLQWYYPSLVSSPYTNTTTDTMWDLYQAPYPWGPWTIFQSNQWTPKGFYSPALVQKSLGTDGGRTMRLITAGNYFSQDAATGDYQLTLMSIDFS